MARATVNRLTPKRWASFGSLGIFIANRALRHVRAQLFDELPVERPLRRETEEEVERHMSNVTQLTGQVVPRLPLWNKWYPATLRRASPRASRAG